MSDQNRIINNEELLVSNMLEIQALIRILQRKGITTEDEVLKEIIVLKKEMDALLRESGKEN